mgnify:FL=1
MGQSISKSIDLLFMKKEFRLLMLGLDAAGKTTILYKMKLGGNCLFHSSAIPTAYVPRCERRILVFNRFWRHYYGGTQALIFVVDSSDRERIEIAKEELQRLLNEVGLKDSTLLIFANKQDLSGAMSSTEVAEKLDLVTVNDREWYIQGTCAMTGDGLYEGLDWLSKAVSKKK